MLLIVVDDDVAEGLGATDTSDASRKIVQSPKPRTTKINPTARKTTVLVSQASNPIGKCDPF
jgi:hypothetical protein